MRRRVGAVGQRFHRLRDGRLVEDLTEAQHRDDVAPGEARLADAGGGVHVDPAPVFIVAALEPKRLREGGEGDLPLVAEVLVPEPAGVDLLQLVRRPRRVRVQLRRLHQGLQVLPQLGFASVHVVLGCERVLALPGECEADAHAAARGGADLDEPIHQSLQFLHARVDVLQDDGDTPVFQGAPVYHVVDLVDQSGTSLRRARQVLRGPDPRVDLLAHGMERVGEIHRDGGDDVRHGRGLVRGLNWSCHLGRREGNAPRDVN
mmetsp:Transcript_3659/g.16767  ORF Transcript_3659/g.16767 Transcript_3659/m.16767 type:complete len:261 (+) Transcript_3659:2508-3290(+)